MFITLARGNVDSVLHLPFEFIASGSEVLILDSTRVLDRETDYSINYRQGTVVLASSLFLQLAADALKQNHTLEIRYKFFPFRFQDAYYKRKLVVLKDSTGGDTVRVARAKTGFNVDDIFGQGLQKSGSIVRGFTVGSNRDLSLNSGLRLQLAGKISSDLEVIAALTDESTPIQPEGTTQTLQEFDKVFVEMRGTDFSATLGDFNLDFTGTEFARLSRKLQGAKGTADYRFGFSRGTVTLSGAAPRGKYTTNQFQGIEAVQGPYRLTGRNNERTIIVIAGTEKVYVNGEQQTRGETNAYTIDYSTAEVTFTPRRMITSASRIVVDFEYTDRQYARSLLAGQTSSRVFDENATLTVSYFREADDQDSPIDLVLSDSDRVVLANAGDDQNKAIVSGVTLVDSNGYYIRVDTVENGTPVQFFQYAPGRAARYNVGFSNVGFGKGDYERVRAGEFRWKGTGKGEYLPIRFLPLPQSLELLDLHLAAAPISDLRVSGEFGRSVRDANRFSSVSDNDNAGHALKFAASYAPKNVRIGGVNIGSFDLQIKERFVDSKFVPLDRTNDIEFNRKWGFESAIPGDEEIQEASLRYAPITAVSVSGGYGKITRGDALRSVRNDIAFVLQGEGLPKVDYYLEDIRAKEISQDNSSKWLRQRGKLEYSIWKASPTFRYESEKRNNKSIATMALREGSFDYDLFAPGLTVKDLAGLSLSSDYEWRVDNIFSNGAVVRESKSFTQSYGARLAAWNNLSSSLDVTLREKKFSQHFKMLGKSDIQTVLVRNQTRFTPLNRGVETDLFYEVVTGQASRLERGFVKVTPGSGNYRYLGDLNGNGIADSEEFQETRFDGDYLIITLPTDQLYPVIDLKTSMRVRLSPRLFLNPADGAFQAAASVLSTETYVRVEEKSNEQDLSKIYLLHFSRFQRDSTTIAGATVVTQDVNIMEGEPAFSSRLRFSQRKGLNNFSGGIERSYLRERSIRLRWQLVREIANQIDYINRVDRVSSAVASNRLRDILSNTTAFDLSYRPEQNVELGLKFEVGTSTDKFVTPALDADLNTQSLRLVYAFQGSGQARVEVSREEVLLARNLDTFPFELTGGRVPGKTWLWRAGFDYRVTEFIQATMNYDGRSEGGRPPAHTGRAEVRAFF